MRSKAALIPTLAAVARSRWEYGKAGDVLNGEKAGRIRGTVDGAKAFVPVCMREMSNGPNGGVWFIRQSDDGSWRIVPIVNRHGTNEVHVTRAGTNHSMRVACNRYLISAVREPADSASNA
jgi:hypothetical protein